MESTIAMTPTSSSRRTVAPSGTRGKKSKRAPAGADGAKPPRKRVAYEVSEDHDDGAVIVWAKSTAEARREAMGELNRDFNELSTKRVRELDGFKGDLNQWKFENGWWSTCHYGPCHNERCGEDNGAVYRDGIWACCEEHVTLEQERRVKQKAREAEATAEALRVKPGSTVHGVHINPDNTPILDMTFPSGVRRCHTFLDWLATAEGQKA